MRSAFAGTSFPIETAAQPYNHSRTISVDRPAQRSAVISFIRFSLLPHRLISHFECGCLSKAATATTTAAKKTFDETHRKSFKRSKSTFNLDSLSVCCERRTTSNSVSGNREIKYPNIKRFLCIAFQHASLCGLTSSLSQTFRFRFSFF